MKSGINLRSGLSITELTIIVLILSILLGLLLISLGPIRQKSSLLKFQNQQKRIGLAIHSFVGSNNGKMPGYAIFRLDQLPFLPRSEGLFKAILPYGDFDLSKKLNQNTGTYLIAAYINEADPSFDMTKEGNVSLGANYQAYQLGMRIDHSYPDGLSNTISVCEKYARCTGGNPLVGLADYQIGFHQETDKVGRPKVLYNPYLRRATFADPTYDDVLPISKGMETKPSIAGKIFQIKPALDQCDYRLPQTPFETMVTSMMDGSVQLLNRRISPEVFWAQVTPDIGD
jgi:type II secretory pathway pseudopilin PulG